MTPWRRLLALLCLLCLLGAQQAAYAHWISHIGGNVAAVVPDAAAADNGDAPTHSCTSCAAYATLAAAPPLFAAPALAALPTATPLPDPVPFHAPTRPAPPYGARAPPAVL